MKKTYVYRNGKMVLKDGSEDSKSVVIRPFTNYVTQYCKVYGDFTDEYIPSFTQPEIDKLASVMGGAQTNDFIQTHIRAHIKTGTQLPGGVHIPDADYLELEPGTHWWQERKRKDPNADPNLIGERMWTQEVSHAKVLRLSSPPPMPQPRSRWETPVQHLPWVEVRPTPPRRKSVQKPPIECQEAWDTLHPYFQAVP